MFDQNLPRSGARTQAQTVAGAIHGMIVYVFDEFFAEKWMSLLAVHQKWMHAMNKSETKVYEPLCKGELLAFDD